MALVSSPISTNTITYGSTRQISRINTLNHRNLKKRRANCNNAFGNSDHPPISGQPVPVIQTSRQKQLLVVPILSATNSSKAAGGDGDGDGDECQGVRNLSSIIQPLRGKKQVLAFFLNLIRHLGTDIEFIVRPTMHDGMNVGVQWSLEWNKKHLPLGKGSSFHISQHYKGKVIINFQFSLWHRRNESCLFNLHPIKMMGFMSAVMEKMGSKLPMQYSASKVVWSFLLLFITAAFLISLMIISH